MHSYFAKDGYYKPCIYLVCVVLCPSPSAHLSAFALILRAVFWQCVYIR